MTDGSTVDAVGHETQELRFATAMTGGVSLAIWMGGVAREMNLLERASKQRNDLVAQDALPVPSADAPPDHNVQVLYLRLLNLLDMTVDADILSGTSAGGINAALLGMARVNDLDLGRARGIWLRLGALEDLLRDPREDAPPSLLQGDDKLLEGLKSSLEELWPSQEQTARAPDWPPTRVHLSTTLITGESGRFTDSYGTLVEDVSHQGMFTFDEEMLSKPAVRPALATAGRCTASFPLAFEPGFVSLEGGGDRPAMERYANITRAHWASDGGLLMNRPIQPMLQEIFDRRAERHVRRVLLYVIPSTGEQPDPRSTPKPAELDAPLTVTEALLGDFKAVIGQSVAADLRAIREHNDRVDSLCDTRLRMAQLALRMPAPSTAASTAGQGAPLPGMLLTDTAMFADYRVRQSDWFVRPVVAALMREIASRPRRELPEAWKSGLVLGSAQEAECRRQAAETIADTWSMPDDPPDAPAAWYALLATFGLAPFEGAKATAITMIRSSFALAASAADREELGHVLTRVHEALGFGRAPATSAQQSTDGSAAAQQERDSLGRPRVGDVVRDEVEALVGRASAESEDLPAVASDLARTYRAKLQAATGSLDAAWRTLAEAIADALGLFGRLAGAAPDVPADASVETIEQIRRDRPSRKRAAAELQTYVTFLGGAGDASTVAARLFDLHVATRSVLPVAVDVEQPVELVQLSADTRTLLSKRKTANEKLTGMQLHQFGAFYKSSWRANDWTWGRIDGAGWLVHLLLDPRRIEAITRDDDAPRAEAFYGRLLTALGVADSLTEDEMKLRASVVDELRFLDGGPRPTSLPTTALWVAREVQRWIAIEELPVIALEMISNPSKAVHPWAKRVLNRAAPIDRSRAATVAESWVRGAVAGKHSDKELVGLLTSLLITPDQARNPGEPPRAAPHVAVGDELAGCPVPDEKLAQQVGQPLMTRTVAKAAAVSAAMVGGIKQPIVALRPPLTALRTITMAAYRAVTAAGGRRVPLLVAGALAIVVGLVLALNNTELLGVAGAMIFALGFFVLAIVTWGHSKNARKGVVAGLVLGAVLAAGAARETLFGTGTCDGDSCSGEEIGWVGREALPWLAGSRWNVLIVIVAFVTLAALIGSFAGRRWRGRSGRGFGGILRRD